MIETRIIDSLACVGPEALLPDLPPPTRILAWGSEPARFHVAWRFHGDVGRCESNVRLTVKAPGAHIEILREKLVPVHIPTWVPNRNPAGYVTTSPGLLPDPLVRLAEGVGDACAIDGSAHVGWHSYTVRILASDAETPVEVTLELLSQWDGSLEHTVQHEIHISRKLPALKASGPAHCAWIHADSIAHAYSCEPWSEHHWELVGEYLSSAVRMGVTGTIIPLWTPPLDTAANTYRMNVQLLGVRLAADGSFAFDLTNARKFLAAMRDAGMRHVETPPIFTQWGANHAPGIYVEGSESAPHFGWHTDSSDPLFTRFIKEAIGHFLELAQNEFADLRVLVHISDEPGGESASKYAELAEHITRHYPGIETIDALSDPEFSSLITHPVVATDAVARWRAEGVSPRWVYYCSAQATDVSNRFIAMEPLLVRAIGIQMYCQGVQGFLHWGFNFYGRELSLGWVDPWEDSSAGGAFPSGDPFVVYPSRTFRSNVHGPSERLDPPGIDAPIVESLRYDLLREAMRDWALLTAAEAQLGRQKVLEIVDPDRSLDFDSPTPSPSAFLARMNELIEVFHESLAQL